MMGGLHQPGPGEQVVEVSATATSSRASTDVKRDAHHSPRRHNSIVRSYLRNGVLISVWYFWSTLLTLLNKRLVGTGHGVFGKGAFPAPLMMTSLQFIVQHYLCRLTLSTLIPRSAQDAPSWAEYVRTVLPNGVSTGLDIGLSNLSFVFITVSFYVMCKSTTPIFLVAFACLWGLERPSWSLAAVVATIVTGLLMLVAGETKFSLVGFVLVMSAACLAGLRWTLTQLLLQGTPCSPSRGPPSDSCSTSPLEALERLTPVMAATVGTISLAHEQLWTSLPASPYFESPAHSLASLLIISATGLLAFMMVWTEFQVIQETSALTFMIAGTFKEVVTVLSAVVFMGDEFTVVNGLGLAVLMTGVGLYNFQKYQKMKQGQMKSFRLLRSSSGSLPGTPRGGAAPAAAATASGTSEAEGVASDWGSLSAQHLAQRGAPASTGSGHGDGVVSGIVADGTASGSGHAAAGLTGPLWQLVKQ